MLQALLIVSMSLSGIAWWDAIIAATPKRSSKGGRFGEGCEPRCRESHKKGDKTERQWKDATNNRAVAGFCA